MDIPERELFLGGFGWAGVVSLLTWLLPVALGGPLDANVFDLVFAVLILGVVGRAVYTGKRQDPSTLSVALSMFVAAFATIQFFLIVV